MRRPQSPSSCLPRFGARGPTSAQRTMHNVHGPPTQGRAPAHWGPFPLFMIAGCAYETHTSVNVWAALPGSRLMSVLARRQDSPGTRQSLCHAQGKQTWEAEGGRAAGRWAENQQAPHGMSRSGPDSRLCDTLRWGSHRRREGMAGRQARAPSGGTVPEGDPTPQPPPQHAVVGQQLRERKMSCTPQSQG